ncbi:hypothetical protein ACFC1T_08830 [Kitasatospora sp. NPDC056076]|uniref:hypothetical protein n=1 Tax=Kitasatospora sp. NPDC056076 TaxID=3345703 RepID=UPI0035E072DA
MAVLDPNITYVLAPEAVTVRQLTELFTDVPNLLDSNSTGYRCLVCDAMSPVTIPDEPDDQVHLWHRAHTADTGHASFHRFDLVRRHITTPVPQHS